MQNRLKTNKVTSIVVVCLAMIMLGGCVTVYNPATQRNESLLIDTPTEVSLGRDMDISLQNKMKMLNDSLMQARLDAIGKRVALVSDRQDLKYYFRIVSDKEFNAFAIPGGFIYVNSGLMQAASDDELACVLAHEIGHIAAKHSVKKLQATLSYNILMSIIVGATGEKTIAQLVDVFVFNPATLAYSRQDELLADKLAVRYAKRAKFNPYGMVTFFEKLKKEKEKTPQLRIEIFSSHPDMDERIKKVKEEILTGG